MDPTSAITAGGSVGLFVAVGALLIRLIVLQNRREDQRDQEIVELKEDVKAGKIENAWCNKRVAMLIAACLKGGIEVPQEVWDGPPEIIGIPRADTGERRRYYDRRANGDPPYE